MTLFCDSEAQLSIRMDTEHAIWILANAQKKDTESGCASHRVNLPCLLHLVSLPTHTEQLC